MGIDLAVEIIDLGDWEEVRAQLVIEAFVHDIGCEILGEESLDFFVSEIDSIGFKHLGGFSLHGFEGLVFEGKWDLFDFFVELD